MKITPSQIASPDIPPPQLRQPCDPQHFMFNVQCFCNDGSLDVVLPSTSPMDHGGFICYVWPLQVVSLGCDRGYYVLCCINCVLRRYACNYKRPGRTEKRAWVQLAWSHPVQTTANIQIWSNRAMYKVTLAGSQTFTSLSLIAPYGLQVAGLTRLTATFY